MAPIQSGDTEPLYRWIVVQAFSARYGDGAGSIVDEYICRETTPVVNCSSNFYYSSTR